MNTNYLIVILALVSNDTMSVLQDHIPEAFKR